MPWPASTGAFQPEELAALKALFDEISSKPWFSKDERTRKSFAKYLFDTYPGSTYVHSTSSSCVNGRTHVSRRQRVRTAPDCQALVVPAVVEGVSFRGVDFRLVERILYTGWQLIRAPSV